MKGMIKRNVCNQTIFYHIFCFLIFISDQKCEHVNIAKCVVRCDMCVVLCLNSDMADCMELPFSALPLNPNAKSSMRMNRERNLSGNSGHNKLRGYARLFIDSDWMLCIPHEHVFIKWAYRPCTMYNQHRKSLLRMFINSVGSHNGYCNSFELIAWCWYTIDDYYAKFACFTPHY